jgi:Protein of unknown function (DUF3106)
MKAGLQFGAWVCGLGLSAALLLPCARGQSRPNNNRPPATQQQVPRNDRPTGSYHPQGQRDGQSRQPAYQGRGRGTDNRPQANPNNRGAGRNDRPQSAYRQQAPAAPSPNVLDRLRNMTPQERTRLAENQRKFNQLPLQRQQDMKRAAENWEKLTPEQRNHIRNDVLPKWQQLPADRQRAIQQRLGVLQNMPESARNRHLNDPNFTRTMNEEDKAMLRDLSHQHVGAPDPPQEQ